MSVYRVEEYSKSRFGELLNEYSHDARGYSEKKSHLLYLDQYLQHIGTRTILVEQPYTDRDYIEDYAAYYARCHASYSRHCARFHFFKEKVEPSDIELLVAGDASIVKRLQVSYLGFMVVKPLPSTIVGRTCLATYGSDKGKRFFVTREYKAHVLGIELIVQSLAFQEQDVDVAACATSALWSVFHSTGLSFQRPIPSPAEITKAATANVRYVDRSLPAMNGLSAEQMSDAIRSVGLEPLQINAENPLLLKAAARAYLLAGIPCLLLGALVRGTGINKKEIGLHAVAVTGFGAPDPSTAISPFGSSGLLLAASCIEKFYVHDDGIGPFARMEFTSATPSQMTTSWGHHTGTSGQTFFEPQVLLIPVYHKIRVPIDSTIATVAAFDTWIEAIRTSGLVPIPDRINWDISLIDNAKLKAEIFTDLQTNQVLRAEVLKKDLPHYMWRVVSRAKDKNLFELFFDATDLLQGGQFIGGLSHDKAANSTLGAFFGQPAFAAFLKSTSVRALEDTATWFATNRNIF